MAAAQQIPDKQWKAGDMSSFYCPAYYCATGKLKTDWIPDAIVCALGPLADPRTKVKKGDDAHDVVGELQKWLSQHTTTEHQPRSTRQRSTSHAAQDNVAPATLP